MTGDRIYHWNLFRINCLLGYLNMVAFILIWNMKSSVQLRDTNELTQSLPTALKPSRFDEFTGTPYLVPDDDTLEMLNETDLLKIYWRYINTIQTLCRNQSRFGHLKHDGKEVCLDEDYKPSTPCLVYSFGSNFEFGFDLTANKFSGCEVHTFDPTMDLTTGQYIPEEISFHNVGIDGRDYVTEDQWEMNTLQTIMDDLRHTESSRNNRGSAGGYFLAGRNMNWIPVGASLFASNIGSLHFVGMVGSGAASGIAIALYELNAMYVLLILAYIFLPVYIASGVYTMPEYLKRRFGGKRIQIYLAVLALLVYIFTKISADLYAGAIFIEQSLNWNIYGAIFFLLTIAAVFTIVGGLTAVIWTDFIQTVIMLVGALVLMVLAFIKVGGFSQIVEKYPKALSNYSRYSNNSCGQSRADYMHLFRDAETGDIPWPGLVGITINSIWYWCSDQVIVQRALAAKSYDHAKAGTILCAFIKTLPLFMLVIPGMIARILYTETVACADPKICMEVCGSESGCYNIAYPSLVIDLMPHGARGLMLAVMLSALMSSLTSIFNSAATIFAMDVWVYARKMASELELMIVGRVFVVVLVIISIIWVPVLKTVSSELYVYIQQVSSFLQPPICCIFLLAIFWERLNEKGAFTGLIMGMIVGLIRFILEYSYPVHACTDTGPDPTPSIVKNFHYLYFSTFLFLITGLVAVVVSLLTKPIDPRCLERLTYWTRNSKRPRLDIDESESSCSNGSDLSDHVKDTELSHVNGSGDYKKDVALETGVHDNLIADGDDAKALPDVMVEEPCNTDKGHLPWYRRTFNYACGLEDMDKTDIAHKQIYKEDMLSITEDKRWKIGSDVAAVLSMVCCVGLAVYFR